MSAEIDRLEIAVEASASKANQQLERLANKLNQVSKSLSGINAGGLSGLANDIEKLGKSMQTMNTVKTSDFTRLANNIQKLTQVNAAGLNNTASAIQLMSRTLNHMGTAAKSTENIAVMAKGLGKLGGENIQKAIANLPPLSTELKNLMTTLSQAPNVSKNVIQMTNALANLGNSFKAVGNVNIGKTASHNTAALQKLSAGFSALSGGTGKATRSLGSFSRAAGSLYTNCFLIIRGLKKLGSAITNSFDYVETLNYWNVTMDKIGREFGGMYEQYGYDSAESYAESFSGRLKSLTQKMTGYKVGSKGELFTTDSVGLGLDPEAIMKYQASIAAVTNSVGLIGETSTNAAKALSMLSADMSSLKNIDMSTVMTNFQSGLIGQSRALYKYGIDITNATLQTYAYREGISKAVSEMSQAEKMQLRLIAILDQSRIAWGDQANTLSSVANQYRIMRQQITNLARTIGNLFLPIIQKVLPFINGLIIAVTRLFTALGFKMHGGSWLEDIMDGISGGGGDSALDDLADSADDAENALKDANSAAEKLKTTTLGIDEFNINSPQTESGDSNDGSSAGGGIDLSGAIGDALGEYELIWDKAFKESENKAQEWADAIAGLFQRIADATKPFRDAVKRLWDEGLSKLANFTWTALKDFYNEFLVPMGKWAFGTPEAGLTRLVDIINNSLLAIDWERLNTSLKNFWIAIEPYAEQFGEGLIDFFEDMAGLAVDVINAFPGLMDRISSALEKGNPESARKWGYALGVLGVGLLGLKGVATIISGLAKFGTALSGLSTGLGALFGSGGVFAKISSAVGGLFAEGAIFGSGGALASLGTGPLIVLAVAIAAISFALIDLWKTSEKFRSSVGLAFILVKDSLVNAFDKIGEAITPLWEKIKELGKAFYDFYESSGLKRITEQLTSLWVALIGIAGSVLIEKISSAITGLCEVFGGLVDILTGVLQVLDGLLSADFSKIQEGLGNIGEGIGGTFSGIGEILFGWIDDVQSNLRDKIGEPLKDAIENIKAWWAGTAVPFFQGIPDWFAGILVKIRDLFVKKWNEITDFLAGLPEKIGKIINDIGQWFSQLPEEVGYALGNALGKIIAWGTEMWEYLSVKIPEIIENVKTFFWEMPEKIYEAITMVKDRIAEWATEVWSAFNVHVAAIVESVRGWFAELPEKAFNAIMGVIEKLAEWKTNVITFIKEQIPKIIDELLGLFTSIPEKFQEIGRNIIAGLWKGIQDAWDGLKTGIGDFCKSFVKGFKDGLDIHSPSRKMAEIGDYSIMGLFRPFSQENENFRQLTQFANSMLEIFSQALSPEKFSVIALNAMSAFTEAFNLAFLEMQPVFLENLQIFCTAITDRLLEMAESMGVIFESISLMISTKWMEITDRTRNSWLIIGNLIRQNLVSIFNNVNSGMDLVNSGWFARWQRFIETVRQACAEVMDAVESLNRSVEKLCDSMISAIKSAKKAASSLSRVSVSTSSSIRGFAGGGFPNTGELFMARENGITEMVGAIGNRPTVANNDQIVDGIRQGVYEAVSAAMAGVMNQNQEQPIIVNTTVEMDGRTIVQQTDEARRRMGWNFQPV